MKKNFGVIGFVLFLITIISCVPKSKYDALVQENERLKIENDELLNGEERTIAIIDEAYSDKDYVLAKESIEKLKKYHPESRDIPRFEKLLVKIQKEEDDIKKQKELEEKERIRRENYNNTGNWYVLSGYYIEYKNKIEGLFSNFATEDSKMDATIRINKNRSISFKIYEYQSNNPVKGFSRSPDRYYVSYSYKTEEGANRYGHTWGTNRSDEIEVYKEDSLEIINLLKENIEIKFEISGTGHKEHTEYKFTLKNVEWFENALRKLDEE